MPSAAIYHRRVIAGAATLLLSPILVAVGAVAVMVSDITLVVERDPADQLHIEVPHGEHTT